MEKKMNLPENPAADLLSVNRWLFFLFIVAASIVCSYYLNTRYNTEDIMMNTYGEQLTISRIHEMMENTRHYQFIAYAVVPLIILVRICYNCMFIGLGNFIAERGLSLDQVFNICLKAEVAFVLLFIVRIIFVELVWHISTLQDLNRVPFSLMQLLNESKMPKWAIQPISYCNFFELLYMIIAAGAAVFINGRSFWNNFLFILGTYGVGLLLWSVFLVYLVLMLT